MKLNELQQMAEKTAAFGVHPSGEFIYSFYTEQLQAFAKLIAEHERSACADIADRLPRIYRETEEAHYRLSPDPFQPSRFGFDFAELRQAEAITHSIRARENNA